MARRNLASSVLTSAPAAPGPECSTPPAICWAPVPRPFKSGNLSLISFNNLQMIFGAACC